MTNPSSMRVAILMWHGIQVRLTHLLPTRRARLIEAPGALGCEGAASVTRRSDRASGWEYAEAEGRALAIKRLSGYDDQRASEPFLHYSNINVAYPYSEQPLVIESKVSIKTRSFASLTLLRPSPFDPAQEFEGIQVAADGHGTFHVTFPDNERAYISLSDAPPAQIELNGVTASGATLRCVWLNSDSGSIIAIGATTLAGICTLDADGTVQLKRTDNSASIITSTGLRVNEKWFGGVASKVEARTLDDSWVDVTNACEKNQLPAALVREWSKRNERTLVEFRVTR